MWDDQLLAEHVGGYTPFEADVTEFVRPGEEFRLTVRVNNQLSNVTIPPGSVTIDDRGRKKQTYLHDFYTYAGLARSVWLYSAPAVRVDDITVVTGVDGVDGVVAYEVATTSDTDVRVQIRDAAGNAVGAAEGARGEVRIPEVKLWQPGATYLYEFTVEIVEGGELVDTYPLAIGVRTVEVKGNQFLVNGEPFYFTGFGKHEDTPVRQGARRCLPRPRLRADEVDRRQLVPHVSLSLRGRGSGVRRPTWHRHHRRDGGRRAELFRHRGFGDPVVPTFGPDTVNDETKRAHVQATGMSTPATSRPPRVTSRRSCAVGRPRTASR